MAALPTVPLAVPGDQAQEMGSATSAYSAEDWHTWRQQQRWRDWSWGRGMRPNIPPGEMNLATVGSQTTTLTDTLGRSRAKAVSCGNTTKPALTELGVPAL
eukprot:4717241-Amphidinium_carterae.1